MQSISMEDFKRDILDSYGNLKLTELQAIFRHNDLSKEVLINFLRTEQYSIEIYDFEEIIKLFNINFDKLEIISFLEHLKNLDQTVKELNTILDSETISILKSILGDNAGLARENEQRAKAIVEKIGSYLNELIIDQQSLRERKINEYVTLKLEHNQTNIYVQGQLFNQCKYLLLNLPVDRLREFDDIESIDDAAERLDRSMEGHGRVNVDITPEAEFWGHCSNLQAWVENDYDTRILHRNLAFPLLKRLSDIGDTKARRVLKDEIAKRIEGGNFSVVQFLLSGGYLQHFSQPELTIVLENINFAKVIGENSNGVQLIRYLNRMAGRFGNSSIKSQIRNAIAKCEPSDLVKLLSKNLLRFYSKNEIGTFFETVNFNDLFAENPETTLIALKNFATKGVLKAYATARSLIKKSITDHDLDLLLKVFCGGFLELYASEEVEELFNQLQPIEFDNDFDKIVFLAEFAKFRGEKALGSLKAEISATLKTKPLALVQVLEKGYLQPFSDEDLDNIFNTVNKQGQIEKEMDIYAPLQNLKRLMKRRVRGAERLFKIFIKKILYNGVPNHIISMVTGRYIDLLTDQELKELIEAKNSELIDIIITSLNNNRLNYRTQFKRVLAKASALSRDLVSEKIKKAMKELDFNETLKFGKTGALVFLNEKDKNVLLIQKAIDDIILRKVEQIQSISVNNLETCEIVAIFRNKEKLTKCNLSKEHGTFVWQCDCFAGRIKEPCKHFWIVVIYALKKNLVKQEDFTLTNLPYNFEKLIEPLSIVGNTGRFRIVNSEFDKEILAQHKNSKILVQEAHLINLDQKTSISERDDSLTYLMTLENVNFSTIYIKKKQNRVDSIVAELDEKLHRSAFLQIGDILSFSGDIKQENDSDFIVKNVRELKVLVKTQPKPKPVKIQYKFKTFDSF